MRLFTSDLFKAFATGFAVTAIAMSNQLVPGLWQDLIAVIA